MRPKTITLAMVCAAAMAGLFGPGRQPSYGQEGNRKPACGCFICETTFDSEAFEYPSRNCAGIVGIKTCRENLEQANLPQSTQDAFWERVRLKRIARCSREGPRSEFPAPPVPAPLPPRPNATPSPEEPNCEAGSNVTPTISIELAETLNIDESPKMPDITATAKVTPSSTDVSWTGQITYAAPRACSGGPQFDSPKVNGEGETFTPDFGAIFGGKLEITATTKCGKGAATTTTRNVGGLNADGTEVRNEIGTLEAPFEADDLKKIACHESRQRQFRPANTPTFGPGGDAGIMQICYRRTAGDIWNWKTNIASGRANLLEKVGLSRGIPRTVRRQSVRGKGPFPNATDFTPEQLRLEAIKRYNAGNLPDVGYWEWDDAAGAWVANPQGGGDPAYVENVTGQNANCP